MLGHILKRTLLLVYVILTHLTHRLTQLLWICHSQNLIVLIIIDGYKIRNYTSPEGRIDKTQNIVHCNWGWLGNSNGYFVSGIFKTNEGVSYDYSGTPQNEKYWYLFNTITYDKPVKTD